MPLHPDKISLHPELTVAADLVYGPCGLDFAAPQAEAESSDYGAYAFRLGSRAVRFRVAKITPTKVGQFVTVWKRIGNGPIQPFDDSDPVDFFVIACRAGERAGQFVFPKDVLVRRDILARDGQGGKRGIRVYPPWDVTESRQAMQTQRWQGEHFLELPADAARVRALYGFAG